MNTILAIDYGKKFTGLAIYRSSSDPYPLPLDRVRYQNDHQLIKEILNVCHMEEVDTVVVGIPRLLDGKETPMTRTIRSFILQLQKQSVLPVYEQDETLSTYEAEERMKNSARYNFQVDLRYIDAMAASIILEDFLSTHNRDIMKKER